MAIVPGPKLDEVRQQGANVLDEHRWLAFDFEIRCIGVMCVTHSFIALFNRLQKPEQGLSASDVASGSQNKN